jgi:hypothetical protein
MKPMTTMTALTPPPDERLTVRIRARPHQGTPTAHASSSRDSRYRKNIGRGAALSDMGYEAAPVLYITYI